MIGAAMWIGRVWRIVLCTAVLTAAADAGQAATIRGKITCEAGRGYLATGYYFTVFNAEIGRSKPAPVEADGTFFLYNIPAGDYVLEAWSKSNPATTPKVFQLKVYAPYTDVPAIVLAC